MTPIFEKKVAAAAELLKETLFRFASTRSQADGDRFRVAAMSALVLVEKIDQLPKANASREDSLRRCAVEISFSQSEGKWVTTLINEKYGAIYAKKSGSNTAAKIGIFNWADWPPIYSGPKIPWKEIKEGKVWRHPDVIANGLLWKRISDTLPPELRLSKVLSGNFPLAEPVHIPEVSERRKRSLQIVAQDLGIISR